MSPWNLADHRLSDRDRRRRRFPLALPFFPLLVVAIVLAATGHVPWLPVLIFGGLVLLLAPSRRRHWGGRYGYAC